jgi:hypothetical protein
VCERANVPRSDEDARTAIVHEVGDSPNRGCDHRKTERHSLEDDHRQPLAPGGKAENVGAGVLRSQDVRTDHTYKRDRLLQALAMNRLA